MLPPGGTHTWLGIGLAVLLGVTGCSVRTQAPPEHGIPTDGTANHPPEEPVAGVQATVMDPPRQTTLASRTPGADINLRSQPTTQSPIVGRSTAGDSVRLLRLAEGEGGYTWYYAQSVTADQAGWVRGDFVDVRNAIPVAAGPEPLVASPAQPALDTTATPCGLDRQEAFFETQSYAVHLCRSAQGLRYVGRRQNNPTTLVTDDVVAHQSLYIAIDGSQQYHISETQLDIYNVQDGNYTPLASEPVLRFDRFLY